MFHVSVAFCLLFRWRSRIVVVRIEAVLYHLVVPKPDLTIDALKEAAAQFADVEKAHGEPSLYGITDGKGLRQIVENDGNIDDLIAFMQDKQLPVDDIEAQRLAEEIMVNTPEQGYLTVSNALQWRLQYSRVIEQAGTVDGVVRIR